MTVSVKKMQPVRRSNRRPTPEQLKKARDRLAHLVGLPGQLADPQEVKSAAREYLKLVDIELACLHDDMEWEKHHPR